MRAYAYLTAALSALAARVREDDSERGDVPGWVMVTVMTIGLAIASVIPSYHHNAQPRQRFAETLGRMLCRKGPACPSVIGDGAHAEAKPAKVHTQVK